MPDSVESRLMRLEREASALQQRVDDIAHDVDMLAPVRETIAEIRGEIRNVVDQIAGLRQAVADDRRAARERGEKLAEELSGMRAEQAAQARDNRKQLWTIVGALLVAIIGAAATILAAGIPT